MTLQRPSTAVSLSVLFFLVALWGGIRLVWLRDHVAPITFVLPMLVCLWTGRAWHIWALAVVFAGMALMEVQLLPRPNFLTPVEARIFLGATFFNIVVGAGVIHFMLGLRERIHRHQELITRQNSELEAQAEELSQQNEEIRAQAEELAEQNEEIEAQSEEVARQNEDLVEMNTRLCGREEILQGLLQSAHERAELPVALAELCRRALQVIGSPARDVAVFRREGDDFLLEGHKGAEGFPEVWPMKGSIGALVFQKKRTAYVSDLDQRPDLAAPFLGTPSPVRSVLATPIPEPRGQGGLLVVCSSQAGHWSDEQFRVVEWIAAQCALIREALLAQKALADHTAALEAAHRSKDRFLAMLSHELRTPLTPVLAAAGVLESDPRLPEDVRSDLAMIRRNAGVQSRLIDDLLDLTRISRGKIDLDLQVLPILPLIRDTVSIVSGELDAKGQRVVWDVSGAESCAVDGDGPRLQQVFWNLLRNAIKFSPGGATIYVSARRRDEGVAISIRDEGVGILPEDAERIFLPFEQGLDFPNRAADGGLGLGLAIAKAILELHNGRIRVASGGPGCGATFEVELPLARIVERPAANQGLTEQRRPSALARVLLVEDHGDTGRILARILQGDGYQVAHAETVRDARELFGTHSFDVVISDLGLPDGSGLDLIRQLRAENPDLPGICLSGYGMEDDIRACREAGFQEHLTKPVDIDRLRATIARVLSAGRRA